MKALSVREPWASMIASGEKTIETRTRPTKYRGPLLICVSKKPAATNSGQAIAIVELVDCFPMGTKHAGWQLARCNPYPGAYGWHVRNVRRITPFPVRGQLGIFNVEVKG